MLLLVVSVVGLFVFAVAVARCDDAHEPIWPNECEGYSSSCDRCHQWTTLRGRVYRCKCGERRAA